jgi:hypothetical protein
MMKWLQDNPLGLALGALCALLLCTWLVLAILSSLPLSPPPADDAAGAPDPGLELPTLAENLPMDTYNVITARPLFNETRLPVLDDVADDPEPVGPAEEEGEKPDVELAGVIITPSLRMVTLKRKDNQQSQVAFEGRPIEADFGSWHVSRVLPREATLTSASGEELLLEMKVHDAKIEPPPPVVEKAPATAENAAAEQDAAAEPLSRAEEIRQRIAERREELRREAEEADEGGAQAEQPSYQQAIQSMIGRKRQQKSDNTDEQ